MAQNPFVVGQWVRGERFYGRTALLQEVLDGPRNWLWLLGTRRLGKTSFLKQLEQITTTTPERGYFPVFWDLQGGEDEDELHQSFREALLDAEERFDAVNVELSDVDADDLFAGLGRLRRRLRTSGRRLLLLCDETEELLTLNRSDPSLLRKLRRALQSHDDIRSVLTSTIRLWELADQRGDTSPFLHGFAPPLYLSTLTDDEARLLIGQANLAQPDRPGFAPAVVEEIRTRCDNHPYLIQLTCKRFLEIGDLKEAIEQVRNDRMVSHFFSVDYDLLAPMEQTILRLVAQRSAATSDSIQEHVHADVSSVRATLQRLEQLAFIRRDPDRRFVLRNSFFCRWLEDWACDDTVNTAVTRAASPEAGQTHAVGGERGLGTISGRYGLLQRVGEGATGIVYKAHDAMLNTDIAIKVLRPEFSDNEAALDRFRQEIILSRDIGHPNVLRTYHLGEFNTRKYLTMQWVEGQTLERLIAAEAPFDEMTGVGIAMRLAAALEAAHARKVLHRDVKPQNILVDRQHEPFLMDFGLARLLGAPRRTSSGIFLGTPDYASPEQARLLPLDERSDLYALGVVLFEMMTGRRPFESADSQEVLDLHKSALPPDPNTLVPRLSPRFTTIILRCLEKDRGDRYPDAGSLRGALEQVEPG